MLQKLLKNIYLKDLLFLLFFLINAGPGEALQKVLTIQLFVYSFHIVILMLFPFRADCVNNKIHLCTVCTQASPSEITVL